MDTYAFNANIRYGLEAKGSLISIKISFFIGLGHMAVLEQDFIIVYIIIIYIYFYSSLFSKSSAMSVTEMLLLW